MFTATYVPTHIKTPDALTQVPHILSYHSHFHLLNFLSDIIFPLARMAFPYKHVVMIGATSGIGKAMAERLIQAGSKVTVVGRRKERLEEFVQKHGHSKSTAVPFDIGNLDKIPQFASE
jgi:NADPH:quinone reductase-like Zn-dependent oxidoreductase